MFHCGHLAWPQIKGGAELAIANLMGSQAKGLVVALNSEEKSWINRALELNFRSMAAVETNTRTLCLPGKRPCTRIIFRPKSH
jgi:hypothetical protein